MAFKIIAVICLIGCAIAEYDYNNPHHVLSAPINTPKIVSGSNNSNSSNNIEDDNLKTNSFSTETNSHDIATPLGYDYRPQQQQLQDQPQLSHQEQQAQQQQQQRPEQPQPEQHQQQQQQEPQQPQQPQPQLRLQEQQPQLYLGEQQQPQQHFGVDSYAPYAYPPANYEYSYSVNDQTTGDIKSHSESRDGYNVRGVYSLVDPDGFKRTVTYTADGVNGFNAVVNREPIAPVAIKSTPLVSAAIAPVVSNVKLQPVSEQLSLEHNEQQQQSQSQQQQQSNEASHVELPIQPRDSYASPPSTAQFADGPYA